MAFPYKCVLVTGATSGIGHALAEKIISHGSFVIAVGRRQDRLDELVERFGKDKVAAECFDIGQIEKLEEWTTSLISKYPNLDAAILNAGFQHHLDILQPSAAMLPKITSELQTNYLSPVHTTILLLSHLQSLSATHPTAVIFVSSGLALVPSVLVPTYSAGKAAIHSIAWTFRAQVADEYPNLKIIEIIPPAVQTELHTLQGKQPFGMPLAAFTDEAWRGLTEGEEEIPVGMAKQMAGQVESERKVAFGKFTALVKGQSSAAGVFAGGDKKKTGD